MELFALSVAAFQRTDKIFQMVAEALFLLVDIQLFDVGSALVPVGFVIVRVQRLFERVGDTFDFLHPFFFRKELSFRAIVRC